MAEKLEQNGMDCSSVPGTQEAGLFVHMSRTNHACIGNSSHHYLARHGVMILIASCRIEVGI